MPHPLTHAIETRTTVRVHYADTDKMGVVSYANYLVRSVFE